MCSVLIASVSAKRNFHYTASVTIYCNTEVEYLSLESLPKKEVVMTSSRVCHDTYAAAIRVQIPALTLPSCMSSVIWFLSSDANNDTFLVILT